MSNKVFRGTPTNHTESMCSTCRSAHSMRGLADSSERVYCDEFYGGRAGSAPVPQPIISCNKYDDTRQPSMHDMQTTAWILMTDKTRRAIGFISPQEAKRLRAKGELDG